MDILREKVIKAHLRRDLEPTDAIIKSLVYEIARGQSGPTGPASTKTVLKLLLDADARFWAETRDVDTLISRWFLHVAHVLQSSVQLDMGDIKDRAWQTFHRRLSLDVWLVYQESKYPVPSQGNMLVTLMLDSIEESIYRQFPVEAPPSLHPFQSFQSSSQPSQSSLPSHHQSFPSPQPPRIAASSAGDSIYADLFAAPASASRPKPLTYQPALDPIPEDPLQSEFGMKIKVPRRGAGGMSVRLRGGSRKKKSQPPPESSGSDSEPETTRLV